MVSTNTTIITSTPAYYKQLWLLRVQQEVPQPATRRLEEISLLLQTNSNYVVNIYWASTISIHQHPDGRVCVFSECFKLYHCLIDVTKIYEDG